MCLDGWDSIGNYSYRNPPSIIPVQHVSSYLLLHMSNLSIDNIQTISNNIYIYNIYIYDIMVSMEAVVWDSWIKVNKPPGC